ncbi:MAG: hypothetical protein ACI94Y_002711 [Maribacter sp.]|jgi:hypothetical protein
MSVATYKNPFYIEALNIILYNINLSCSGFFLTILIAYFVVSQIIILNLLQLNIHPSVY